MKYKFSHYSTRDQVAILIEEADLIVVNNYHHFSCYLYSYETKLYELTWDNIRKKALIVRTVEGGLLDKYLEHIELPNF